MNIQSRSSRLVVAALLVAAVSTDVGRAQSLHRRAATTNDPSGINEQTFDFLIVGGGAAGLTLANRLSADGKYTVAVIEAGDDGAAVMDRILIPALAYTDGIAVPDSPNDWGYWSNTLQRWLHQPRGKILGGSTAVNALYMVRASEIEHDAWAKLQTDTSQDWSWNGLFPYMKKIEHYHPPSNPSLTGTQSNLDFHGQDGPVQVSYPEFNYETEQLWTPTLANLGLKTTDPQGGEGWGGFITPNSIDPKDGTRSYSKTAYLDPAVDRGNLNVLTEHQVIKIDFSTSGSTPRATGVQFQKTRDGTVYKAYARREILLSAGVFGTPQLLELSGVGAKSILDPRGITQVADVPGVGEHFQDHVLVSVTWSAPNDTITGDLLVQNATFKQEQIDLFKSGKLSQSLVAAPNNGIGYVNLRQLFGEADAATFIAQLKANMTAVLDNQQFTDPTVKAGYEATYTSEANDIIDSDVGVVELLLSSFGSWNQVNRTVSVQVAIQHPMSRGSVHLNTTNAWDTPIILANYLNTDSDWQIMRAGVKYLRRLATTEPLSGLLVEELSPGPAVQSDADIDGYIFGQAGTQYHPASTSSMLPLDKGGVVGPDLKVYRTEGLRVVDSSVVPIGLCAHLMGPTYAIAEKAADIILANPMDERADAAPKSGASSAHVWSPALLALMVAAIPSLFYAW